VAVSPEKNEGVAFSLQGGVTFAYGPSRPAVLRGLDLALPAGRTVAVMGLSGLGKTTLLNLLALLWDPAPRRRWWGKAPPPQLQGRILYHSPRRAIPWDYRTLDRREQTRLRGRDFGLVPQVSHFLSGFTCRQNLRLPLALLGLSRARANERIDQLLELARDSGAGRHDLAEVLQRRRYPVQVSTGQRQRLSVLRAVVHDPVVLFADEPVSNLDARNKGLMLDLFKHWRANDLRFPDQPQQPRTLLLVCHEAETAWEMGDLFLFLHPPGLKDPPGATAQLLGRAEFCRQHGIAPDDAEARFRGPEALRRHIGTMTPLQS
jgi:ABC-type lipoprotein export system ATPase subunit